MALPSNFPLWTIRSVLPLNLTEVDIWTSASPVPSFDSAMLDTLIPLQTDTISLTCLLLLQNEFVHY